MKKDYIVCTCGEPILKGQEYLINNTTHKIYCNEDCFIADIYDDMYTVSNDSNGTIGYYYKGQFFKYRKDIVLYYTEMEVY